MGVVDLTECGSDGVAGVGRFNVEGGKVNEAGFVLWPLVSLYDSRLFGGGLFWEWLAGRREIVLRLM